MEHNLIIDNKKSISVTAVEEVNGFAEKEIKITLIGGEKLLIFGQNLKISSFAKESGNFVAVGEVLGVKYLGKSVSFFKKLVK